MHEGGTTDGENVGTSFMEKRDQVVRIPSDQVKVRSSEEVGRRGKSRSIYPITFRTAKPAIRNNDPLKKKSGSLEEERGQKGQATGELREAGKGRRHLVLHRRGNLPYA